MVDGNVWTPIVSTVKKNIYVNQSLSYDGFTSIESANRSIYKRIDENGNFRIFGYCQLSMSIS